MHRRSFVTGAPLALAAGVLPAIESKAAQSVGTSTSPTQPATPSPSGTNARWTKRPLLRPDLSNALYTKYLEKPVHETLLIDDMEADGPWHVSPAAHMSYTAERAKFGTRSLRFSVHQADPDYIAKNRAPNGSFNGRGSVFDFPPFNYSLRLKFATPQDWSRFNRISLWCYLNASSPPISCVSLQFLCAGAPAGPSNPFAMHYLQDLRPGEWNRLLWEIPEYPRDQVTEFIIFQPTWGVSKRGYDPIVTYDFDQLQLERVDCEPYEGWSVSPGKIAFNHVGYAPGARKLAFASSADAREFQLLDAQSDAVVANLPVRVVDNRRGRFQVLDFTSFVAPGRYRLRCGALRSGAFSIAENVWRGVIEKSLNFFYADRCGFEIPEIHDACHMDASVSYQGDKRPLAGGWHDAANLSQGPLRTNQAALGLLQLYEQLATRKLDTALADRVLEEARWGLEWVLRMRFGDGMRLLTAGYSCYTDNEIGTHDDVVLEAVGYSAFENLASAAVCAYAARIFASLDEPFAKTLLQAAKEDFAFGLRDRTEPPATSTPAGMMGGSWRDEVGYATYAAVELFKASGERTYEQHAQRLGRWLLAQQEQRFVGGNPLTGYFYEDPQHKRIHHDFHGCSEESALLGLRALCETFPAHDDWMNWYAGTVLYSEFFCRAGAAASAPYELIPSAVWRKQEIDEPLPPGPNPGAGRAFEPTPLATREESAESIHAQRMRMFEDGAYLAPDQRLRMFPIWPDQIRHGNTTVHLTMTAALGIAAQVRNEPAIADLVAQQLQWVFGGNPFSQTLMYGEGYDYQQLFTVALPGIVGGMPVGMNSFTGDTPAWPNNAVFPYKEIWVVPSARLILDLATAAMPAHLTGTAAVAARFKHLRTGVVTSIAAGAFDLNLPAGSYTVEFGGARRRIACVDGGNYSLTLDPKRWIDIDMTATQNVGGKVQLTARVVGQGMHELRLRTFNIATDLQPQRVTLGSDSQTATWTFDVLDAQKPWIVLCATEDPSTRTELFGTLEARPTLD